MTAKKMIAVIAEIRKILGNYRGDEKEILEALVVEAEGWKMRLEELESQEENE